MSIHSSTQHSLELAESSVKYWEYNPEGKHAIVMIHGFRGDHHGLEYIARSLPAYRILIPDLPGFGASSAFDTLTHDISGYTVFVRGFLAALKLTEPPVLLGHSFGSIVAAKYAALHPKTISKLVLINPIAAPPLSGPKAALSKLTSLYYWLGNALPARAGEALLKNKGIVLAMSAVLAKTKDKELRKRIHGNHLAYFSSFANRKVVLESFQASIAKTVTEHSKNIITPTLLIAGDLDDIAPPTQQAELQSKLPDARLIMLTGVGHLVHYEAPEKAAAAIAEFIG
ncbi:MAG TPA: alpha/beta hydrolase [Candidatus Saccharimonadales bacterium]